MARPAAGMQLLYLDGSTYTAIGEITNYTDSRTNPEIDTSHMGSTKKTYRAGVPDAGSASFTVWFNPEDSSHDFLFDCWDTSATEGWKIQYPAITGESTGPAETFNGFLTSLDPDFGSLDDNVSADVTIKRTGAITQVAAS